MAAPRFEPRSTCIRVSKTRGLKYRIIIGNGELLSLGAVSDNSRRVLLITLERYVKSVHGGHQVLD